MTDTDALVEAIKILAQNQVNTDREILNVLQQVVEKLTSQDERIANLELLLIKTGQLQ